MLDCCVGGGDCHALCDDVSRCGRCTGCIASSRGRAWKEPSSPVFCLDGLDPASGLKPTGALRPASEAFLSIFFVPALALLTAFPFLLH